MLLLPLRLDLAPHLGHRLILYFNPRTPVGCDFLWLVGLVFVAEEAAHVCLGAFVGGFAFGVLCRVGHVRQLRRWVHERVKDVGVRLNLL